MQPAFVAKRIIRTFLPEKYILSWILMFDGYLCQRAIDDGHRSVFTKVKKTFYCCYDFSAMQMKIKLSAFNEIVIVGFLGNINTEMGISTAYIPVESEREKNRQEKKHRMEVKKNSYSIGRRGCLCISHILVDIKQKISNGVFEKRSTAVEGMCKAISALKVF